MTHSPELICEVPACARSIVVPAALLMRMPAGAVEAVIGLWRGTVVEPATAMRSRLRYEVGSLVVRSIALR